MPAAPDPSGPPGPPASLAAPGLPRTSREIRLAATPEGLPEARHLTVVETPLPQPGPGQLLVRNSHFALFAGLRTLMGAENDGVPLPPLRAGDTVIGPAVGEVVAAPAGSRLRPGDPVTHLLGWREYAVLPAGDAAALGDVLPDPVAHLAQGSSAYGALTRLAEVRPGDTVLVTGAAGAVGVLAGQIARLLGAGTVIGTTGSPAKAERLVAELGYDAVVLRGPEDFTRRLAEAAPDGIDVLLDLVGGEQLTAAVAVARPGARFALVGALSGQLAAGRGGGSAPAEIDTYRMIVKGLSVRGYTGGDHPDVGAEWNRRFGAWLRSGRITFPYTAVAGLGNAPRAFEELLRGRHFGGAVVEVFS
ncbi:NADP-dependent oxidoreductase [uncultured Streptomyces sp.]|uniref:MDR family NADP-dependent oxidoreductase n=1 Tax=uncultured Streptomyces sp. TaxID=174707 RepID=UPI0026110480|nr:NADP-dependent oxidoreductase [uncultured Streptomyces sp.]